MIVKSLKTRVLSSYLIIILAFGISMAALGYWIMKFDIMQRAQFQVKQNLSVARFVYNSQITELRAAFSLITNADNLPDLKSRMGLDYLFVVDLGEGRNSENEIVRRAAHGSANGGSRVIRCAELCLIDSSLCRRSHIDLQTTPKAQPTNRTNLTNALAVEFAIPFAENGKNPVVIYGGKILNRRFELVDRIHDIVYENQVYMSKPVGTVTLFLDDVRIATNVLDNKGNRAVGTRVSSAVYENVVTKGIPWFDRAFVVTDWYLTAYEPIRDVSGAIVGILYVGTLEHPFKDRIQSRLSFFLLIVGAVTLLALSLSFVIAASISKHLSNMLLATEKIASGDLAHRLSPRTAVSELNHLAESFNEMSRRLSEREKNLQETNQKLAARNKNYLDLIGIVSHDLRGILSSATLNTHSVRGEHLGQINPSQKKALDSVIRNLEYFDSTIRSFFDLSRIERGEMELRPAPVHMWNDIISPSLEVFTPLAQSRGIQISYSATRDVELQGDPGLLLMVVNNLLGNAVKYGTEGGRIILTVKPSAQTVDVEVYNDGRPLLPQEYDRLFQRFSRLATPETTSVRGTGLGLFISRQIVEKHGGRLWCEPREQGNAFVFSLRLYPMPGNADSRDGFL